MTVDPINELAIGLVRRLHEGMCGLDAPDEALLTLRADVCEALEGQLTHSRTTSPLLAIRGLATYTEAYFRARTEKFMLFLTMRYGRVVWDVLTEARYSLYAALVTAHYHMGLIGADRRQNLLLTYAELRYAVSNWQKDYRNN